MADIQAIVDQIKELTLLEASELVKADGRDFRRFRGSGSGCGGARGRGGGGEAAAPAEEKTEFDVVLQASVATRSTSSKLFAKSPRSA